MYEIYRNDERRIYAMHRDLERAKSIAREEDARAHALGDSCRWEVREFTTDLQEPGSARFRIWYEGTARREEDDPQDPIPERYYVIMPYPDGDWSARSQPASDLAAVVGSARASAACNPGRTFEIRRESDDVWVYRVRLHEERHTAAQPVPVGERA